MENKHWNEYIAKIAYYKWEEAGRPEGEENAKRFWQEAEIEFYEMLQSSGGYSGPFSYLE